MKRVLSGIQPTSADLHFGNYFGAIQNWVALQNDYECVFTVVDYHAMTMPYDPIRLRENTWNLVFGLLALGVRPENLCIQSLVPEHTELGWILNCFASYGELTRMTQFKDKSEQLKDASKSDFVSVGLFDYPVLQAADILIYKADFVPVGKDQEQHLELTRNIATRFNNSVKKEYFQLPAPLFTQTPKIQSLADPTRKMSKSLGEKHFLSVFEPVDILRKKIRSAVTDVGGVAAPDGQMSEGVANLFSLLKAAKAQAAHDSLFQDYTQKTLKYADLKQAVSDAMEALVSQFTAQKAEILTRKKELKDQIRQSAVQIRSLAQKTLKEVKELAGLANVL